jgi:hypothetical protein
MKTGHCYQLVYKGTLIKGRIIRNDSNTNLTMRLCNSQDTVEIYYLGLLQKELVTIEEINCEDCDGQPSLEAKSKM